MNNRRKLVIALGAGALVAPLGSFAQQPGKVWRVGFLAASSRPLSIESDFIYGAFLQGMQHLGYVEGKNFVVDWRFGDNDPERLSKFAAELVGLKVDVIMTRGSPSISAAQKATTFIPIVMGGAGDPISSGFVKSLARPEGNITGLSQNIGDVSHKYLQMLLSLVPKLSRVGVLMNPGNVSHAKTLKNIQTAALKTNVKALPSEARSPQEIELAFSKMTKERVGAVIIAADPLFTSQRHQIAELQAKYRLPCMAPFREYVEAGSLISYGLNLEDHFRRAATYVDKILKGTKPSDIPVEQPTVFELFINRRTAKALGLTIPQSLLISADKIIE